MSIVLTQAERQLFHFLLFAAQRAPERPVLRVAGGWFVDLYLFVEAPCSSTFAHLKSLI